MMYWTHVSDSTIMLLRVVDWRLNQILPGVFQKQDSLKTNDRLESIGKKVGLAANEVETAVNNDIGAFEAFFHKCLKWILLIIIIVGGFYLIRRATYVPGTYYGTITPQDFN